LNHKTDKGNVDYLIVISKYTHLGPIDDVGIESCRKTICKPLTKSPFFASHSIYGQLISGENIMQHTALEKQLVQQQDQLAKAVIALSQGDDIESILRHVGELSMQLTGARYAMLSYIEDEKRCYIPLGMSDDELALLDGHEPQGIGLLGLMWEQHKIIRINNIGAHPKASGFPQGHASMESFLGAPIMFGDQIEGVIYLTEKKGRRAFTLIDETIVRTLASACAVAISNASRLTQLKSRNAELESLLAEKNQTK